MRRLFGAIVLIAAINATAAQASVVYVKNDAIYVTSNSGAGTRLLVAGGSDPKLSPDGQSVVYAKDKMLFKIATAGGPSVRLDQGLAPCEVCFIGDFAPDGGSVLAERGDGSYRIPLDSGPAVKIALSALSAHFSPDSKSLISADQSSRLEIAPSTGGPLRALKIVGRGTLEGVAWTPSGIVVQCVARRGKSRHQLLLLGSNGSIKRILHRARTDASARVPFGVAGKNVITFSGNRQGGGWTMRLIKAANGKVIATRKVKRDDLVEAVSQDGRTLLIRQTDRLQTVDLKTGKRTTIVKAGAEPEPDIN